MKINSLFKAFLGGFLVVFFCFTIATSSASIVARNSASKISPQGSITDSGVYYFRNSFELKSVPSALKIHITADTKYAVFINGKFVARGSEAGDLKNWYFDTLDIVPFLQKGKNTIAVQVANFGGDSLRPQALISRGTFLWVQADSPKFDFLDTSPKNWKVIKGEGVKFVPLNRYSHCGGAEHFDANKMLKNWQGVDFDDSRWANARTTDVALIGSSSAFGTFNTIFCPRDLPPMEETPIRLKSVREVSGLVGKTSADINFINGVPLEIPANTTCRLVLDAGFLTSAFPEFLVSGGTGAEMSLSYCESFFSPAQVKKLGYSPKNMRLAKGNRNEISGKVPIDEFTDVYKFDGSKNALFTSVNYKCFRYIEMNIKTATEPLVISDFKGIFTAYPFKENAAFVSSDDSLKDIWNVGWRTARLCAFDTYFDCPFYERMQYTGDTRIQALISLYVSGDARLMKKAIKLYGASRQDYGLTQSRYPSWKTQYIPPFSLYWVNMLRDYYMHVQDAEFVATQLDGVETVVNWFAKQIDSNTGMLKQDIPFWNFVDWVNGWKIGVPPVSEKSGSAIISMHLAMALDDASELMSRFGRNHIAEHYRKMSATIKQSVYKNCWNPTRGLLADAAGLECFSQHANIFGILSNTIPQEKQGAVLEKIITQAKTSYAPHKSDDILEATFYFKFYLFKALEKLGRGDQFLQMLEPWRDMIKIGLTTFAENPEPTRSDCHAWSASPMYYFLSLVCGVTPSSPEFKTVRIVPNLGSLQFAKGVIMHPNGEIIVDFKNDKNGNLRSAKIILPKDTTGELFAGGKVFNLVSGEQSFNFSEKKRVERRFFKK